MRFKRLDESSKLKVPDESFDYMPTAKKKKYIEKVLKGLDNYQYLKPAEYVYETQILENGFDRSANPFINYIEKIKTPVPPSIAEYIGNSMVSNDEYKLNPNWRWLYKKALYNESPRDILWKINALSYFEVNGKEQKGKNATITLEDLLKHIGSKQRMMSTIKKADIKAEDKNLKTFKEILTEFILKNNKNIDKEKVNNKKLKLEFKNQLKRLINDGIDKNYYDTIDKLIESDEVWQETLTTKFDKRTKFKDIADYIIKKWY